MAIVGFSFDDLLVKIALNKLVKDKKGPPSNDYYVMMSFALKIEDIFIYTNRPKVGEFCLDDDHHVLAMKKLGYGTKSFKKWLFEEVTYKVENPSHPSMAFWQSQYEKWRLYNFVCDPKVHASHNLVETLLMRLSFHLRNENLLHTCKNGHLQWL